MSRINNEQQEGEKSYPFARWMSWLFLTASALLLVYTYYRSEIAFLGVREDYFKYYLIALTGILFLGGCASVARRDSSQYSNGRLLSGGWTLPG